MIKNDSILSPRVVESTGQNISGWGLAGLIIQVAMTAANSDAADYVTYAHVAIAAIAALPYGPSLEWPGKRTGDYNQTPQG